MCLCSLVRTCVRVREVAGKKRGRERNTERLRCTEKEGDRERQRERERDRDRERDREGDRDRVADRDRETEIDRQTDTETDTQAGRQTETERQRHTETDRQRFCTIIQSLVTASGFLMIESKLETTFLAFSDTHNRELLTFYSFSSSSSSFHTVLATSMALMRILSFLFSS